MWCIRDRIAELVLFSDSNRRGRLCDASNHKLLGKISGVGDERREAIASEVVWVAHECTSMCSKFEASTNDVYTLMPDMCLQD